MSAGAWTGAEGVCRCCCEYVTDLDATGLCHHCREEIAELMEGTDDRDFTSNESERGYYRGIT
jgi:hypothetical protein